MKRPSGNREGISIERSYWLRCFLEKASLAIALCLAATSLSWGQIEHQGPIQIWRLHGIFVNPEGKPLEYVSVTLLRNGAVAYQTHTDASGRFAFEHVYGRYWLHIDQADYSQLNREVNIGTEVQMALRPKALYVIAGPGACADDCSSVFTSKSEFERTIQRNTAHHY
jgi:hypothetical protein